MPSLAHKTLPLLCLLALAACKPSAPSGKGGGATLAFVGAKGTKRAFDRGEIAARFSPAKVEVWDPSYKGKKRYRAVKLAPLLQAGLGLSAAELRRQKLLFVATDGYKVAIDGERLAVGEPYLALGDADHPPWTEIPGHRGISPGPFYVVWKAKQARDQKRFPWPWALATVRVAPKDLYAKTVPVSSPAGGPARRGHKLFIRDCVRCHAINQQGGNLGPDLNVPKNVLEYRSEQLLRAFIKNPKVYRYGNMPAQPQLSSRDLDDLLAYLRAMRAHKHDPKASAGPR
jgi:mono/diheme cytochrome c family protein